MHANAPSVQIVARAGCDRHPLDPGDPEDRLTLLSYIWPDELDRIERMRRALDIAASDPPTVAAQAASAWLGSQLAISTEGELTVVWQSIFRQYVDSDEWAAVEVRQRRPWDGGWLLGCRFAAPN